MAKRRFSPREFRQELVELVRAVRMPDELSREFAPSAKAIRNSARKAEIDPVSRVRL